MHACGVQLLYLGVYGLSCSFTQASFLLLQYNTVVGSATQFYDQGVELTEDGLYAQHSYLTHVTRGTLSLHSLYVLLWANFAAFSVALLTQYDTEQKLTGTVFSDSLPLRQHCASQLQKMWTHIQKGLAISDDERAVLVHGCFRQFFEVYGITYTCTLNFVSRVYALHSFRVVACEEPQLLEWKTADSRRVG